MKRAIGATLILLVFGATACHRQYSGTPFIGGVTLAGRVVDVRGRPVAGAQVELYATDDAGRQRPVTTDGTNASGYFSLRSIDPGVYLLRVVKFGFPAWNERVTVGGSPEQTVNIQL